MTDIVERLKAMLPRVGTCESDINAVVVSNIQDAIAEISRLRADVVLMRSITGKALDGGMASFTEIKKEIRNVK